MGYHFSMEGAKRVVGFLLKMVHNRVFKVWTSGPSLPVENVAEYLSSPRLSGRIVT